uniref:Uncharacterized protein n=1 Tax=Cacopsylla melanoneura TaxID=428564 RepID=A0A8D9E4R6_9HEMI
MLPPTRSVVGLGENIQDDPLLTQEEKNLYIRLHQELKYMEQKPKAKEKFDLTVLNNHIATIFALFKLKNKDIDSLKGEIQKMTAQINDLEAEKQHLQLETSNLQAQLQQQILNTNNAGDHAVQLLNEKYEIIDGLNKDIEDKNQEIALLKAQAKASDSSLNIGISEQGQSMNNTAMNITTSQDFFVTPMRRNESITIHGSPPSDSERTLFHSPEKDATISQWPEQNVDFQQEFIPTQEDRVQKTTEQHQPQEESAAQELMSRITQLENKLSSVLKKVDSTHNNKFENKGKGKNIAEKQPDILILGDQHAKNLKNTIAKSLPSNFVIHETFLMDGTISQIQSTDDNEKCKHLLLMAGSNDIQKTPMKDIKASIDAIFNKYRESTIHFIQIPFRYDNLSLNYHINNVNTILTEYVRRYGNVKIYETQHIIENWDYTESYELNRFGKIKLCREISKNIKFPRNSGYTSTRFNIINKDTHGESKTRFLGNQTYQRNNYKKDNGFQVNYRGHHAQSPREFFGNRYFHNGYKRNHGFIARRNQQSANVHPVSKHRMTSHQPQRSTQSAQYNHRFKAVNPMADYDYNEEFPNTLKSSTLTRTVDFNNDDRYYFY